MRTDATPGGALATHARFVVVGSGSDTLASAGPGRSCVLGRLASLSLGLGAQGRPPFKMRGLARVGEATQTGLLLLATHDDSERPARLRTVARLVPRASDLPERPQDTLPS